MALESIVALFRTHHKNWVENGKGESKTIFLSKSHLPQDPLYLERFAGRFNALGDVNIVSQDQRTLVTPFSPFMELIKDHCQGKGAELLEQVGVSPLHYDLYTAYFSHGEAARNEELLFFPPCLDWEHYSIQYEVRALLEEFCRSTGPKIFLIPSMRDLSLATINLLKLLESNPVKAPLWILAFDPPPESPSGVEDAERMALKIDHYISRWFEAVSGNDEETNRRIIQIHEGVRNLVMFFCFEDAERILSRLLSFLEQENLSYDPILKLDLEFLMGLASAGIGEQGQALEHLGKIEEPLDRSIPFKKYFQFYSKQSEIYLFRNSFEMAAKSVYQARKYQKEGSVEEDYQVLFLQFSNPQLLSGPDILRRWSVIEEYINWLKDRNYTVRYIHLCLRPDILEGFNSAHGSQKVEEVIRQSISLSQELRHKFFESEGWSALGTYFAGKYELQRAIPFFNKGLAIRQKFFEGKHVPQILNGAGYACLIGGDFSRAYRYFQKSLGLLFQQKNHLEVVLTLINLGYTCLYGFHFEAALHFFQSAYQLANQLKAQDIPYHSRREIYLFISFLYYYNGNFGKASEYLFIGLSETPDTRPSILCVQNLLLSFGLTGDASDKQKEVYQNKFWQFYENDYLKVHYTSMGLILLSSGENYPKPNLKGKWFQRIQEEIRRYRFPSLMKYAHLTHEQWVTEGRVLHTSVSKVKTTTLKENMIFREAQQARMVMNLEKRIQEISLVNQVHQRILHNKSLEPFLLQVRDLIYRNFVCDQIQIYLDPGIFVPQSLEIISGLEDLEPWIRKILFDKGDQNVVFSRSPDTLLPRKISTFGYFPLFHESLYFGGIMVWDLETSEERMTVEDGDFLGILSDQISAGMALFFQTQQLENRAIELMFAKEQVESSLRDLEKSQFHLIQTEKSSAIGQLVAGVAHEINSPLGAVKSMANSLGVHVRELLARTPGVSKWLSEKRQAIFDDFLDEENTVQLTNREERKLRRAWEGQLEERGIPDDFDLPEKMVELGWKVDDPRAERWLGHPERMDFGHAISYIKKMVTVIGEAVRRAQKIVFALKSFTQGKEKGASKAVSIPQSIQTVLTLYRNKLKAGVEVDLQWQGEPWVLGNEEELGQIWTNLIQNALQAMDFQGGLMIQVTEEEMVHIMIRDTGPGVPENLRERIFEPFFTTKREGEGTGLGLHICKQIVERHMGEIWLESTSQGTEFHVRLPRFSGGRE